MYLLETDSTVISVLLRLSPILEIYIGRGETQIFRVVARTLDEAENFSIKPRGGYFVSSSSSSFSFLYAIRQITVGQKNFFFNLLLFLDVSSRLKLLNFCIYYTFAYF